MKELKPEYQGHLPPPRNYGSDLLLEIVRVLWGITKGIEDGTIEYGREKQILSEIEHKLKQ